ncbi:MAG: hypothetical protein COB90_02675 [Hyphomicrobiales bacterium]|nr:MAG: hypothetical protein COB90_02675 [Hyphomicrobiales bacterium]
MSSNATREFRIEHSPIPGSGVKLKPELDRHAELLAEIKSLRNLVYANAGSANEGMTAEEMREQVMEGLRTEFGDAMRLKAELDNIYLAIGDTKKEIASLHISGFDDQHNMVRVADELDAIVNGTEQATEQILESTETIDEKAMRLGKSLTGEQEDLANEIQDQVIQIFEACNFQDLTGQRITKVVNVLKFIEDRITHMIDIWGGIEQFKDLELSVMEERDGDDALLNGPALDHDVDTVSQDDIDALFA